MQADLSALARDFELSPGTVARLSTFDALLVDTNTTINLVARPSLDDRVERHFRDSAQLFGLIPDSATSLMDIGAGGGFPGIVLAIMAFERRPALHFTLVESIGKKARFLSEVAAACDLPNVTVENARAELFHVKQQRWDVITARAVTALPKLIGLAAPLLSPNGVLIFPKGEKAEQELTAAAEGWRFDQTNHPSITHDRAKILVISNPVPLT